MTIMRNPTVSIMMNCYNGEMYLKRKTINSILNQTYKDWELIFLIIVLLIIVRKYSNHFLISTLNIF